MKITNKYIAGILGLLAILLLAISCDDMNDIQSKFADVDEAVYLGKVDSIKSFPGQGRAKITWYIGSDPKIEKTIVYWNMRQDSVVKDFVRLSSGVQKDSIYVDNLPEGSTLFEFRNTNSKGESSLYSIASVTAWGEAFAQKLSKREIKSQEFDYASSTFKLGISPSYVGDSVVYSEMKYTDVNGKVKNIRVNRDSISKVLTDFPDGGELQFRTVFFLPTGIDTVFSAYETFKAPKVIYENGKKLSIAGNTGSRYSERTIDSFYEWNAAGDVILYKLNGDGQFTQSEIYPGLVPRATYREFFFYDDNVFVAVSIAHAVTLRKIVDGNLVLIKTPAGAENLGVGFNFAQFIPAKGFFYSLNAGELKTWLANNNATFGAPNGTTVFAGFTYQPNALFKYKYLIGVDPQGVLWSYPISPAGILGSKSKIGTGWNRFVKLIPVGDLLLALDNNGDLWEFNFDTNHFWIVDKPA